MQANGDLGEPAWTHSDTAALLALERDERPSPGQLVQLRKLMRAVVRDPQGGLLVAVEPLGRGRLARSLVAASWRWPPSTGWRWCPG